MDEDAPNPATGTVDESLTEDQIVDVVESLDLDIFHVKMLADEKGRCFFSDWFLKLRDRKAQARIQARIKRLERGIFGDAKPVGDGVSEMRIDYGPGYRVYFGRSGKAIIVLVGGGDKSDQTADIEDARKRWKEHKNATERFQ